MLDVRQLVGDDAFQLLVVEDPQDAFGRRHRGVLGLRPVANAFGDGCGNDVDASASGRPARCASRPTI